MKFVFARRLSFMLCVFVVLCLTVCCLCLLLSVMRHVIEVCFLRVKLFVFVGLCLFVCRCLLFVCVLRCVIEVCVKRVFVLLFVLVALWL